MLIKKVRVAILRHIFLIRLLWDHLRFCPYEPCLYRLNFRIFAWNHTHKQKHKDHNQNQNTASNAYSNDKSDIYVF